jgi:hypothetical protein
MSRSRSGTLLLVLCAASLACGESRTPKSDLVTPLAIRSSSPGEVLPGTRVTLEVDGLLPIGVATYEVSLLSAQGEVMGRPAVTRLDDERLVITPGEAFVTAAQGTALQLILRLERRITADGSISRADHAAVWRVTSQLEPALGSVSPVAVHLYEPMTFQGSGFLQPGEGMSVVVLDGRYTYSELPGVLELRGLAVPLDVIDRERAELLVTVDLFGVRPGAFDGSVRVENLANAGAPTSTDERPLGFTLLASSVGSVAPLTVRRGQRVTVSGAGFVPTDYALEATTLIALDGIFKQPDGLQQDLTGLKRLLLVPEEFPAPGEMTYVLRVEPDAGGKPQGLGTIPGQFTGRVYPVLIDGLDWIEGVGVDAMLTVGAQRQIVLVKFLPGFDQSLADFGVDLMARPIRDAIMARMTQDYEGVNIVFTEERPQDFVDYSIVEVGGRDPNNAGLLGLDNTEGKDVGNLRFNDVIGGINAATEEQGFYAYGGVFLDSFLNFSPTRPGRTPSDMATPAFDEVFARFSPELGGEPVSEDEAGGGGARAPEIDLAVSVLGNLVGNTIAHEVGHSLGLSNIRGEYHNLGDNPGWIMDSGSNRSFEERSGLGPNGPEVFSPHNRGYLDEILPLDTP